MVRKFEIRPPGPNQDYPEKVYPVTHVDAVEGLSGHTGNSSIHVTSTEKEKIAISLPITSDINPNIGLNIDTLYSKGIHRIFEPTGTLPPSYTNDSDFLVEVIPTSETQSKGTWLRQVAYDVRSGSVFTRTKLGETFLPWQKIMTNIDAYNSELVVAFGPSSYLRPEGAWASKIINGIDTPDQNGLFVSTRYGTSSSKILQVASLWGNSQEVINPIFTVYGNNEVSINGTLTVNGVDLFQSVSNGKTAVANAITQKGISTATNAEFATMASNIARIQTGKRSASGSMYAGSAGLEYIINNLTFKPTTVIIKNTTTNAWTGFAVYHESHNTLLTSTPVDLAGTGGVTGGMIGTTNVGFSFRSNNALQNSTLHWVAIE